MNEQFKYYTDRGFDFFIEGTTTGMQILVSYLYEDDVYEGDNLEHAFAACDLWMEGE